MRTWGGRVGPSLVLLALLVAAVLLVPVSLPTGDDLDVPDNPRHMPVGFLTRDVMVAQQFVAGGSRIRDIHVQIGTYGRVNRGTLRFTLDEADAAGWRTVGTAELPTTDLVDNAFATVPFPSPLVVTPGQPLRLLVQGDAPENAQAVTWWVNPTVAYEGATLSVNGTPQMGVTRVAVRYERTTGPLGTQLGTFIARITPLLNDFWRGVLLVTAAGFVVGFVLLLVRQAAE